MKTEIEIVKDIPWGTHICQFYETNKDLIDILVPYFRKGLENNEFCMWITSKPLNFKEANEAMKKTMPDFGEYLSKGQIEIIPHNKWYLKDGILDTRRVLKGWINKLNQALAKGYEGLRLTGNTFWLEKKHWRDFTTYEEEVNNVIGRYRMKAICTYCLKKCRASEVVDVVKNHQFALINRENKWDIIESSGQKKIEQLTKSYEQLRDLSEHLHIVREEEREKISHEILDELGQTLTALKMDLVILTNKLYPKHRPLLKKVKSMAKQIDTTITAVKRICTDLRPKILDHLGITAAVEWQTREFKERVGIKCDVSIKPKEIILNRDLSNVIFRILQEALTNVARHAKATEVGVSLKKEDGMVFLKVSDNGKGITKRQICSFPKKSLGLIGIKERVNYWGGEVEIKGIKNKGTTLAVRIPLRSVRQAKDKITY